MTAKSEIVTQSGAAFHVPLNRLKKSDKNARKVPHTQATVEARAASIRAKGMLQPLVVEPEFEGDGQPTGYYFVSIGEGRRLAQLLRAKLKEIRKTEPVFCIINTDRRTYHLELRSTEATYMASVSWRYPQDDLLALRGRTSAAAAAAPIASGVDLAALRFRYEITGDDAPWRPLRAFDDGRQVFIAFPATIAQSEAPPLFVVGAAGGAELVNYRVRDNYYVVDRLFEAAELRLGAGKRQARVRIVRTDAERGR